MENTSREDALLYFGAGLGAVCLAVLLVVYIPFFRHGYGDFLQLYTGASLLGTDGLYSPEANKEVHRRVGYSMDGTLYTRLPAYAAIWRPLTVLPYYRAYWCFQAVNIAAVVAITYLLRITGWRLILACVLFLPLTAGLAVAQDISMVVAFCAGSLWAVKARRHFLAGLLLSFCATKFHLFWLVPLVLSRFGRWRMLAGAAVGMLSWVSASTVLAGPEWPWRYAAMLMNPAITPNPEKMPNVHGLMANFGAPPIIEAAVACAVLLAVLYATWRQTEIEMAMGIAIAGGLVLSTHAYIYDCALLLPLLTACLKRPYAEAPALLLLTPAPYLTLLTGPRFIFPVALVSLILVTGYCARRGELALSASSVR